MDLILFHTFSRNNSFWILICVPVCAYSVPANSAVQYLPTHAPWLLPTPVTAGITVHECLQNPLWNWWEFVRNISQMQRLQSIRIRYTAQKVCL